MSPIPIRILANTHPRRASVADPNALIIHAPTQRLYRNGREARSEPQPRYMFIKLVAHSPGIVSDNEFIDMLWGNDKNGGPEDATSNVKVLMHRVRHIGAALGVRIDCEPGRGYFAIPFDFEADISCAPRRRRLA